MKQLQKQTVCKVNPNIHCQRNSSSNYDCYHCYSSNSRKARTARVATTIAVVVPGTLIRYRKGTRLQTNRYHCRCCCLRNFKIEVCSNKLWQLSSNQLNRRPNHNSPNLSPNPNYKHKHNRNLKPNPSPNLLIYNNLSNSFNSFSFNSRNSWQQEDCKHKGKFQGRIKTLLSVQHRMRTKRLSLLMQIQIPTLTQLTQMQLAKLKRSYHYHNYNNFNSNNNKQIVLLLQVYHNKTTRTLSNYCRDTSIR